MVSVPGMILEGFIMRSVHRKRQLLSGRSSMNGWKSSSEGRHELP
jgi:hypothetical protein